MDLYNLLVCKLPGVNALSGGRDVELLGAGAAGIRAFLTEQRAPYELHIRRIAALGMMSLATIVPPGSVPAQPKPAKDRFATAFATVRVANRMEWDRAALLVVEVVSQGEVNVEHLLDLGDFGARLALFNSTPLEAKAASVLQEVVAGLLLALPEYTTTSVLPFAEISFAKQPDGRLLYNSKIAMQGTAISSVAVDDPTGSVAAQLIAAIQAAPSEMKDVIRLLSQSSEDRDKLDTFLCAWTGLEIFLNKVFKSTYEPKLFAQFGAAVPPSAQKFVARMRDVMNDKHNIVNKFVATATTLDPNGADADIAAFQAVKAKRDSLIHGMKSDSGGLPADAARNLLRKYLKLHLSAKSPGRGTDPSGVQT
jgi:hypothetical protein